MGGCLARLSLFAGPLEPTRTFMSVNNAAAAAQGRCSRAAQSRTEAVVVWSTCHEHVGMPEHPVSATFSLQANSIGSMATALRPLQTIKGRPVVRPLMWRKKRYMGQQLAKLQPMVCSQ